MVYDNTTIQGNTVPRFPIVEGQAGLAYLVEQAGLRATEMRPAGGYFRLLSRRLLNGLQFFSGGIRWLLFLPAAILLVPPALILPFLDFLDRDRNFTLGYLCKAQKHWTESS